jgi:hypothetical protein
MPSQSLTHFMNLPAVPSGGPFAEPFTTHWDRPIPLLDNPYTFTTTDEGPDCKVQFVTTAEITGQSLSDVPESPICRILCMYIVTCLSERYIKDACHSLTDIYTWQMNELYSQRYAQAPSFHPITGVTKRQKAPFAE